jgi:hypothetical protein
MKVLNEEELAFIAGDDGKTFDDDVDEQPVQDLALNDPNIFQAEDCDAFDSDVDDEPTAQTIFIANISSVVTPTRQSGPSKSSIISEVLKLYDKCVVNDEQKTFNDIRQNNVGESNEAELENINVFPTEQHSDHNSNSDVSCGMSSIACDNNVMHEQKIYNKVQQTNVAELDIANMGNSNIVPYEQYVEHNVECVVSSNISSVDDNECEFDEYTAVAPDDTLTTRINILKDQVRCYEQRSKFELTECEQKMDWEMHAYITEQNLKEMAFKQEIKSFQNQLDHAFKEKQEIQGRLNLLKNEFQEKETKLLNEFSNLKQLKNKL